MGEDQLPWPYTPQTRNVTGDGLVALKPASGSRRARKGAACHSLATTTIDL
jgi:hypothetical protein